MKKYTLPKDSLVEPEQRSPEDGFIDEGDVEGHGLPTTAPPTFDVQRRTSHGGEIVSTDTEDDDAN